MKKLSKRKFNKMLKKIDNMMVFGPSGTGTLTTVGLFIDEQNHAPTETMNTLYEITHTRISHQKTYRRIPYKYGKHAYRKGVR